MERLSALYATALFELALERDAVDDFLSQATLVHEMLQDAQVRSVLVHPHIQGAEKREFFKKSFGEYLHGDMLGFLFLVTEKNREAFLIPALAAFIGMVERYLKKVTAEVSFATELDDKQIAEMKQMLSGKLGKTVEVSLKVDPSVIGGPYIYVDGYYLDWTVKKRLRDLTVHMKEGCSA